MDSCGYFGGLRGSVYGQTVRLVTLFKRVCRRRYEIIEIPLGQFQKCTCSSINQRSALCFENTPPPCRSPDRSRHRPQLTPQMDDGHQTNCILFPTTIAINGCADSISATPVVTSEATSITNTKFHDFSVSQPHNFRHECNMALISTKPLGVTSL